MLSDTGKASQAILTCLGRPVATRGRPGRARRRVKNCSESVLVRFTQFWSDAHEG
jgi:predicted alpha/beta-hydrolase family hydrolase